MAECIERKAALDAVHKWCDPCGAAVEAVLSVPAADAAPVVRCGGCEYSLSYCGYLVCSLSARSRNPKANYIVNPDFFCAHGKRKGAGR